MAYATVIIEIPNSPADNRSAWQSLRDNVFGKSAPSEGTTFLAENCVSINLSFGLPFFSAIVHFCSSNDLHYSVLITETAQGWDTYS